MTIINKITRVALLLGLMSPLSIAHAVANADEIDSTIPVVKEGWPKQKRTHWPKGFVGAGPNNTDSKQSFKTFRSASSKPKTQNQAVQTQQPQKQTYSKQSSQYQQAHTQQSQMNNEEENNDRKGMKKEVFNDMVDESFPMSPKQIIKFKKIYDDSQRASATPVRTPPVPKLTSLQVSLAPKALPPVVRLAEGFVSSLVFVDNTGAPWAIAAYDVGNPEAFNIQWDKTSNTLLVQALKPYTYGNLAIQLKDLSTPVMITLVPGQSVVDYRVDLHIERSGPNARAMPINRPLPSKANPLLLNVLNGVAPVDSKTLDVEGGLADAWLKGSKIFLRTRLTVLSPSWLSTMSSPDGTNAYEMPKTPMILVSQNGKAVTLKLEGL